MSYIIKTNNDLKYLIKQHGVKALNELIINDQIYRYNDDYYFSGSRYKVEYNILINCIKMLFKNRYFLAAFKLLSPKTYFVTKINEIKKYSFSSYEYYFLGVSLKELDYRNECFTQIINIPNDLDIKINNLLIDLEKIEVLNLINKFCEKIIVLIKNNIKISIININNFIALNNVVYNQIEDNNIKEQLFNNISYIITYQTLLK